MKKLLPYILISLIFHITLVIIFNRAQKLSKNQEKEKIRPAEVSIIRLKDLPDLNKNGKIIVQPSTKSNNKKPKDTKFLSETNNSVEKETIKRSDPGDGLSPGPRKKNINLFPQNTISGIANDFGSNGDGGSGQIHDTIEGIEEGEITALNTVEFKYASFFNRVKRNVAAIWRPLPRLYREDPLRKKYMFKDRRTLLKITLNDQGYIKRIEVSKSSDVWVLDDEAIKAFERCIQFPNPPAGLIKDGHITFYFAFDVLAGGSGRILW